MIRAADLLIDGGGHVWPLTDYGRRCLRSPLGRSQVRRLERDGDAVTFRHWCEGRRLLVAEQRPLFAEDAA